uniref:Putative membrane component protein n=1 Tax=uncultured Acidobacteriota bacterium TaxID=171953 RepID=Q7X348_9BACT|nr:putative membrane component protein [uncultured Acidobacteriota bacterium]
MPTYFQDVSQAVRGLRKRPGFVVAALLTLAVGIGANVTVFSLVNALLLRPLPFGDRSDRVVTLHSTHRLQAEDWDDSELSYRDLVDIRTQAQLFDGIGGFLSRNFTVTTETDAERLLGVSVTPELFPTLGVEPVLGRNFTADEGAAPGLETSVILTHGLWQRRFTADPNIIGRSVIINERARTVVGVMPPGFKFPERAELYMPLRWEESERSARGIAAIGVMKRDVSTAQAQSELDAIASRLESTYPASNRGFGIRVLRFRDSQVGRDDRLLSATLMAAVTFVLLIACANLANLLLVRGAARQREMAVRAAIGASRLRLVWGLLSESAVLAIAGTVLGTLGAVWAIDFMRGSFPEELPYWVRLDIDARIVIFTITVTVLTTLAIGLLPALRASRPRVVEDLKEGSRGSTMGRSGQRTQAGLAVAQVALCLALLVGANLMIRSFVSLQQSDIGFDDAPLLTMRVYLAGDAFDDNRARAAFFDRAVQAIQSLPGVTGVAATTSIPSDDGGSPVRIVTDERSTADQQIGAHAMTATSDLMAALGLELLHGRTFTADESVDPEALVTIINSQLANRLWPGDSALGRRIGISGANGVTWFRVVGIAPDLVYEELGEQTEQSRLNMYFPYAISAPRTMALLIRGQGDPAGLAAPARDALRRVHGGLPVYDVRTMAQVRKLTTWEQQFFGTMMGAFAATALLLACLGIYALLAYAARRRTHEIGVRLALGASPRDVVTLFVGQAGRIGALGLAIGLALAFAVARALSGTLFAVDAFDPWMFIGTAAALLFVVLVAAYIPARRAGRIDPMIALRAD